MPPRKRTRRSAWWMPELAGALWAVLLVTVLLISLPTLGVIPPVLPVRALALLKAAVTLLVIIAAVSLLAVTCDEAWLAVRRWRVRRRRGRVHDLTGRKRLP